MSNAMNKSHLLINEQALQVLPSLALVLGLEEAIAIQQLHYWLNNSKSEGRIDEDGNKWVYNTYSEWHDDNFPFWSEDKIQRIFLSLEKQGVVISKQLDANKRDMRKFYRIDYDKLCAMDDAILRPSNTVNLHDVKMNQRIPENTISPMPLEWQIMAGQKNIVMPEFENREKSAIDAFEQALNIPANWNWYPAKTTDEKVWRDFRAYLVGLYEADNQCFVKYAQWRRKPFAKGAVSITTIKRDPSIFASSWAEYLASETMYGSMNLPAVTIDDDGIPETY